MRWLEGEWIYFVMEETERADVEEGDQFGRVRQGGLGSYPSRSV